MALSKHIIICNRQCHPTERRDSRYSVKVAANNTSIWTIVWWTCSSQSPWAWPLPLPSRSPLESREHGVLGERTSLPPCTPPVKGNCIRFNALVAYRGHKLGPILITHCVKKSRTLKPGNTPSIGLLQALKVTRTRLFIIAYMSTSAPYWTNIP